MEQSGLAGRVALVTGGAGGIGRAIVRRLAAEGAAVVVADIDEEAALKAAAEVAGEGLEVSGVGMDVTDSAHVEAVREELVGRHGHVDVLVNGAGFPVDRRMPEMTDAEWYQVVNVCLSGTFFCSRAFVVGMVEQGFGRVVNISSRAYLGNPGQANYSAAKAGVLGMTRSMAKEFGRAGVTVNAVAPGLIDTAAVRAHPKWDAIREMAEKATPVRRIGTPEDVANVVAFFTAPATSFITGEVLHVAGGRIG